MSFNVCVIAKYVASYLHVHASENMLNFRKLKRQLQINCQAQKILVGMLKLNLT